jgi:hypothetical protein
MVTTLSTIGAMRSKTLRPLACSPLGGRVGSLVRTVGRIEATDLVGDRKTGGRSIGCGWTVAAAGFTRPACRRADSGTYTRVPQWPQRVRPEVVCDCHVTPHEVQFTVTDANVFPGFS